MFCTKCGAPLNDNAKFCVKCGNPVPQVAPVTPAPQAYAQPMYAQQAPVKPNPGPVGPSSPQIPKQPVKEKVNQVLLGFMIAALVLAVAHTIIAFLRPYLYYYNPRVFLNFRMLYTNGHLSNMVCGILLIVATALLKVNVIPSFTPAVLTIILGFLNIFKRVRMYAYSGRYYGMYDIPISLCLYLIFIAATALLIAAIFTKGKAKKALGFVSMALFVLSAIGSFMMSTLLFDGMIVRFIGINYRFLYNYIPFYDICYVVIALGIATSAQGKKQLNRSVSLNDI